MLSPYRIAAPAPAAVPTRSAPIAARPKPDDGGDVEPPVFIGEVEPDLAAYFDDPVAWRRRQRVGLVVGLIAVVMLSLMPWWAPRDPPVHPGARVHPSAGYARK